MMIGYKILGNVLTAKKKTTIPLEWDGNYKCSETKEKQYDR